MLPKKNAGVVFFALLLVKLITGKLDNVYRYINVTPYLSVAPAAKL